MTDKKFSELLYLFDEIERLLVQNGASETYADGRKNCFDDKVNSFDSFEPEPDSPGNISHKFEYLDNQFSIKKEYIYDRKIQQELARYIKYKEYQQRYLEYKNGLIGGNYYVLKKIAYERNKLLHIYNYEIQDHKLFVKDCKSLIRYLENPDKKPFITYSKFTSETKKQLEKLKENNIKKGFFAKGLGNFILKTFIFLSILSLIVWWLKSLNTQDISTFPSLNMGRYIWGSIFAVIALYFLSNILQFITNTWVVRAMLFLASLFGIKYLNDNGFLHSEYTYTDFSLGEYLFGGASLALLVYFLPKVMRGLNHFIAAFLTGIFSLLFSKGSIGNMLASLVPFILGLGLLYYVLIYGRGPREATLPKKVHTVRVKSKKIVHKKCQYYYVQVDILHVRIKASITSRIIDKVYKNEKLCITKKRLHWYYIKHKGWVFLEHINKHDNKLEQTLY